MIDIETLYTAARETNELLPRVRALIPETGTVTESQIGSHRRAPAAPTPWNDTFAFTAYGIADDARDGEVWLTLALFRKARFRPRTDEQSAECISRLPVLIAHAREVLRGEDLDDVEDIARDLARWPRECRSVLDELRPDEQPWTHAPGDLVCPHCEQPLWLRPGWADRRKESQCEESGCEASPQDEYLWCRRCRDEEGTLLSWAPSQWTGLVLATPPPAVVLDADGEQLVTARQAEALVGRRLPAGTVRSWASRGEVHAVDVTPTGAKLYRLADLRERMSA